jgi:hypothetical protein
VNEILEDFVGYLYKINVFVIKSIRRKKMLGLNRKGVKIRLEALP